MQRQIQTPGAHTWYAEIERAIKLKPAINQWIDQLDQCLKGKKKQEDAQPVVYIASSAYYHYQFVYHVILTLDHFQIFQQATLELSKTGMPMICKILLLYKLIEEHLNTGLHDLELKMDNYGLEDAIQAGLDKLMTYIDHALVSDYPLLGTVLHPAVRTSYFEDLSRWDPAIPKCT
ncbi:hypothetical protein K439DRAFT_1337347 [Ramaria rubella]|nr:hypothetical protein K439DRAFT_1337347 [Ramaria rubella]